VFGAGYSIAKHVFLNKNACSKLLGGIDEIEEEMGDDMANRFKGEYGQDLIFNTKKYCLKKF